MELQIWYYSRFRSIFSDFLVQTDELRYGIYQEFSNLNYGPDLERILPIIGDGNCGYRLNIDLSPDFLLDPLVCLLPGPKQTMP